MEIVRHLKTGTLYEVLQRDIIECTNGREELKYVIYKQLACGKLFCREQTEFDQKFKPDENA